MYAGEDKRGDNPGVIRHRVWAEGAGRHIDKRGGMGESPGNRALALICGGVWPALPERAAGDQFRAIHLRW